MKKIILLVCFGIFCSTALSAQTTRDRKTIRIKTSVECKMCRERIEHYFKKMQGILHLNVNYYNKLVTVSYMPSRTNPSVIRTAIANLGYDADTVKANPVFYEKLPDCCKKGGMAARKKAEMEARRKKFGRKHDFVKSL